MSFFLICKIQFYISEVWFAASGSLFFWLFASAAVVGRPKEWDDQTAFFRACQNDQITQMLFNLQKDLLTLLYITIFFIQNDDLLVIMY